MSSTRNKDVAPLGYLLQIDLDSVMPDAMVILFYEFLEIMPSAEILTEIIIAVRALRLVDDIELRPLACSDDQNQLKRMQKLFFIFENKDAETCLKFLTAICNLKRLPKVSRFFRKKIEKRYPGSVIKVPVTCVNMGLATQRKRSLDSLVFDDSKVKRSRSNSLPEVFNCEISSEVAEATSGLVAALQVISTESLEDVFSEDVLVSREYSAVDEMAEVKSNRTPRSQLQPYIVIAENGELGTLKNQPKELVRLLIKSSTNKSDCELTHGVKSKKRKLGCLVAGCVLAAGAVGTGGYFFGKFSVNDYELTTIRSMATTAVSYLINCTSIPVYTRDLGDGYIKYNYGERC